MNNKRIFCAFTIFIVSFLMLAGESMARRDAFFRLRDVPQSYEGEAGKLLTVKSTEDGLEYGDSIIIKGTTGGLTRQFVEGTVDITASGSVSMSLNIPALAQIVSYQMRVDSALANGETWDATLNDGSDIEIISEDQAVAKNTKVNKFSTSFFVTDATTDIIIEPHGGGSFTAQGTIRAIVYYDLLTTMDDL
jgi:hypothetical protein